MIISASRRTDIPAFYSEWFFNRIHEGYVLVRNPMNYHQVSKVDLSPEVVDCIVFWTKDPSKMLHKLDKLRDYKYYFQFTLNPYDTAVERNVPEKSAVIDTFIALSKAIGKEKVIWRYDPIILSDQYDRNYHFQSFEYLANRLSGYTSKCIISFLDLYKKSERNLRGINTKAITYEDMLEIASEFVSIGKRNNIGIEACCEEIDLSGVGVGKAKCIDDKLISEITGSPIAAEKDKNQREICGCVSSIDIGAYNTCSHHCLYCYANFNKNMVENNKALHDPKSPIILGEIKEGDKVTERKMKPLVDPQLKLFFD